MKRSTIRDVAREARVSVSAVSRAFSGGSLDGEKRSRILDVAAALGYRPSLTARSLVSGQSHAITLVTGRMHDSFDIAFVECLAEALADVHRRLIIAPASKQDHATGGVFQAIGDQSDAVIIAAGTMPLDASRACVEVGLPVILAGRLLDEPGVDAVVAENADGGRQAADLSLRTGSRNPAYFTFRPTTFSDGERYEGYRDRLHAGGLEPKVYRAEGREDEALYEAACSMLLAPNPPDAVFCSTDRLAFGVIEAARALRLEVPGDVSVIGFNNVPAAARRTYQLTTVDYPVRKVVAQIIDVLATRLRDPHHPPLRRRIPVSLIVRGTTR